MTAQFPNGEVAKRVGLRPSAVRYYERIAILPELARQNGRWRYDDGVFQRLALIKMAQRTGFTLAETRRLVRSITTTPRRSEQTRAMVWSKLAEVETRIREALDMRRLLRGALRECGPAAAPARHGEQPAACASHVAIPATRGSRHERAALRVRGRRRRAPAR